MESNSEKGLKGETLIFHLLKKNNIKANWVAFSNRKTKADFITDDGVEIDVKIANQRSYKYCKNPIWDFNFHHHGKSQVDIDIFICIVVKGDEHKIFIFPKELVCQKTLSMSERKLKQGRFDYFKDNWDIIKNYKKEKIRMKNLIKSCKD